MGGKSASDDGGDLTQIIHDKYPQMLDKIHGVSEETTTGVHRLLDMMREGSLKVPAINVNDSVTKSKNDNKYGCRHSLNDAVKRATDMLMSGKRALVIGYGDVGKGSAQSLRQEGMIVRVTEVDPICGMQACMDGYEVVSCYENGVNSQKEEDLNHRLLQDTDLLVTCTGNSNVCDSGILKALKDGAVVCNIGHFDNEIDTAFMRENWSWVEVKEQVHMIKRSDRPGDHLILLSEGRLVNLGNAMGHPSRIMDGSFANQVLAQMHLFEQAWADQNQNQRAPISVEVLPKKLDEEVAELMVQGFGGVLTRLTKSQADYIGVNQEGPYKTTTTSISRAFFRGLNLSGLQSLIELEEIELNHYRTSHPNEGWENVFGGQVLAQATWAASRTIDDNRICHSLHGYFLRPGKKDAPILYKVDRIRDGKELHDPPRSSDTKRPGNIQYVYLLPSR